MRKSHNNSQKSHRNFASQNPGKQYGHRFAMLPTSPQGPRKSNTAQAVLCLWPRASARQTRQAKYGKTLVHSLNYIEQNKEIAKVKEWAKRVGKKVDDMLESDLKNEFDKIINAKYRFFNLQNGENPTSFPEIPSKARP